MPSHPSDATQPALGDTVADHLTSGQIGSEETYRVGRNRPPREHRFKPGQSGNPSGCRKKVAAPLSANEAMTLLLDAKMSVIEHGRTRKISVRDALLRKAIQSSASNPRTLKMVLEMDARGQQERAARPQVRHARVKELLDNMSIEGLSELRGVAETIAKESRPPASPMATGVKVRRRR